LYPAGSHEVLQLGEAPVGVLAQVTAVAAPVTVEADGAEVWDAA
jgi:hypothetical protein